MKLQNGDVYDGEMKGDLFHGHGKLISANNKGIYEGEW